MSDKFNPKNIEGLFEGETDQESKEDISKQVEAPRPPESEMNKLLAESKKIAESVVEMAQSTGDLSKMKVGDLVADLKKAVPTADDRLLGEMLATQIRSELTVMRRGFEQTLETQLSEKLKAEGSTIDAGPYDRELKRIKEIEEKVQSLLDNLEKSDRNTGSAAA